MTNEAFHNLVLAELDAVYRLACHLSRDPQQAEDFVQETYLRAFRSAGTFTMGEHGIRPWLFKILHNVIYSSGSRQQREQATLNALQQQMSERTDSAEAQGIVDCSSLDWDRVDARLKAAVMELPMPYRIVFLLSALEGLKYREIAEVTEVPVGTVMSRLSRARAMLAAKLTALGSEYGFGNERSKLKADEETESSELRP